VPLAPKGVNKLATPLGNEDLAIMAYLLNLSVKLCEEYIKKRRLVDKRLFLYCFRKTEQGVIQIKEWQPPSTIDTLKEKSLGNLSDELSESVNYYLKSLIDKEDSQSQFLLI
jgi:hypothetical protein